MPHPPSAEPLTLNHTELPGLPLNCVHGWCPLPERKQPVGPEKEIEAAFPECWRAGLGTELGVAEFQMGVGPQASLDSFPGLEENRT